MISEDEMEQKFSYWPSVSDLFMTLFIVAIAFLGTVVFIFLPDPANKIITGKIIRDGFDQPNDMRLDNKPPIITIADADKHHFFASGSADLTRAFALDLEKGGFHVIATEILKRNRTDRLAVDTLEIIGHTDGISVAGHGNLDELLPMVLNGRLSALKQLKAGSNNDLGLMRALAIKQAWYEFVSRHPDCKQLEAISVRTYSAGQTVPVESNHYTTEDARARRIELRLTKLKSSGGNNEQKPNRATSGN